jgi:hypothetical protein
MADSLDKLDPSQSEGTYLIITSIGDRILVTCPTNRDGHVMAECRGTQQFPNQFVHIGLPSTRIASMAGSVIFRGRTMYVFGGPDWFEIYEVHQIYRIDLLEPEEIARLGQVP